MTIPKIKTAFALDHKTLLITFLSGETKKYDISKLLNKDMFAPLKDPGFFKNVKVEAGGYTVQSSYAVFRHSYR
ncbi:MAG: DUF2442 domain-containing protein [Deltaproteobacteria bacterium]|jgi:hypothetical protein|nr:DUF2442 domain-containing protein [Deltaproteobacteria bacterium]